MPRLGILSVVARKLRIQYPGAVYHAMNRGDRRDGGRLWFHWPPAFVVPRLLNSARRCMFGI
jgi:hypothetical protein